MRKTITKDYETTKVIERRISYLLGARLRERDGIRAAMEKQDRLRKFHPASKHWDSVSEIRKWRETR
ncbi:MAG: hypothetical protein J7J76_03650 [Candidatus Latescibacteria bacterium]|nr:hypothetical protein [Candidatus Latescibacterota bacterium]